MENTTQLIDAETIRLFITALSGTLGVVVGGAINYLITKGQTRKELLLQKQQFDYNKVQTESAESNKIKEDRKKVYKEFIDEAIWYAESYDNIDVLRNVFIQLTLIGGQEVSESAAKFFNKANDVVERLEGMYGDFNPYLNDINAIRKEISNAAESVDIHFVDTDEDKRLF